MMILILIAIRLTAWYSSGQKPVHLGNYEVKLPLKSIAMTNIAYWDGHLWRDITNGWECYFQQVEWRGLTEKVPT